MFYLSKIKKNVDLKKYIGFLGNTIFFISSFIFLFRFYYGTL